MRTTRDAACCIRLYSGEQEECCTLPRMRVCFVVLAAVLLSTPVALAQFHLSFGPGIDRNITPEQMAKLTERSDKGDAEAEFQLGNYYFLGIAQQKDPLRAIELWKKASDQNFEPAEVNLAQMYLYGFGVQRDPKHAIEMLEKAASQQKSIRACLTLSYIYGTGNGIGSDQGAGMKWTEKAAELGDVESQYTMGRSFSDGDGVPEDDVQSIYWYRLAAANGDVRAKRAVAGMEMGGVGTAPDPVDAFRRFRELADDDEDYDSQWQVGLAYARGKGINRDPVQAVEWLEKAAAGRTHAIELGDLYVSGQLVPKNETKAVYWYGRDSDSPWAAYKLGRLYEMGHGVPQDYVKAAEFYGRAADQRNPPARLALAKLYANGLGVAKDMNKALDLAQKAADRRLSEVEFEVAVDYSASRGVPQDGSMAALWFRKAAAHDDGLAQRDLANMYVKGEGLAADSESAYVWFYISADHYGGVKGEAEHIATSLSPEKLKAAQQRCDDLEKTRAQRGGYYEAPPPSISELQKKAEAGDTESMYQLGYALGKGAGLPSNPGEALLWYEKVVNNAATDLHRQLADSYLHGDGVPKDEKLAARWMNVVKDDSAPQVP
jgi:TPR repeat protein